jgi:hypothetical protein
VALEVSIPIVNHIAGPRLVLLSNRGPLAGLREAGRVDRARAASSARSIKRPTLQR